MCLVLSIRTTLNSMNLPTLAPSPTLNPTHLPTLAPNMPDPQYTHQTKPSADILYPKPSTDILYPKPYADILDIYANEQNGPENSGGIQLLSCHGHARTNAVPLFPCYIARGELIFTPYILNPTPYVLNIKPYIFREKPSTTAFRLQPQTLNL